MKAPPVKIAVSGMVVFALAAAIIGIAHVGRRQEVIQLGYRLSQATEALEREQEENRRLRLETSILTSPARIEQLAESLGMTQPGPDQIRVLRVPLMGARAEAGDAPGDIPEAAPETTPEATPEAMPAAGPRPAPGPQHANLGLPSPARPSELPR